MVAVAKKSIFLTFTARCPPYAEVLAFLLSKTRLYSLKLGLKSDLSCTESALFLPKATIDSVHGPAVELNGKHTVSRFFTRLEKDCTLYANRTPADQMHVDCVFEIVRAADLKAMIELVEKKHGSWLIAGSESLTLADVILWDKLRSLSPQSATVSAWTATIEAMPQVKQAVSMVDKVLQSVPVLDTARFAIVNRLSPLVKIEPMVLMTSLDKPRESRNGDFCIPVPRLKLQGNPVQLAQSLSEQFKTDDLIDKCTSSGPFINFFVSKSAVRNSVIKQALTMNREYGTNANGFGKSAIVEFSSPNIAKPFHAGHLRSTIIGNFVQNSLKANGWNTVSINYLGDWGKQYGLLALGFERHGSRAELEKDPIRHLFDVYVKINADAKEDPSVDEEARAYFKRMEDGEQSSLALWKEFRDLSIVKYKEIYGRLNVAFDIYSGESQFSLLQMQSVLNELKQAGLLVPDNGAEIVDMKEHGLGAAIVAKSDGSMLYLSRDIAAAISRYEEYSFDRMFYIVGNQQDHHFRQLFKILELMGKSWAESCTHINFGMIKSKSGQMSTRKGTVVFLEDILDHTQEEMHAVMRGNEEKYAQIHEPEKVSDLVGISSIVVQDMSARRHKDYEFDWSRMLSFEGDTGPYLQYAHSRLCSIERNYSETIDIDAVDLSLLSEPQATALIDIIAIYPDLVKEVAKSFEPNNAITYMFDLCHRVSAAIEVLWVKGREKDVAEARMALYIAARITLGNALRLVGLR